MYMNSINFFDEYDSKEQQKLNSKEEIILGISK